jgi:paraquat-inducible protein B
MKNYLILPALIAIFFVACKQKKETKQEPLISALSIIKGQLNRLDTSLYSIIKYERAENITDTLYLKREEVRKFAAPFLTLPEIADKEYYKNYTEERLIDAQQETLNITSTAKNENAEIQKQIMVITLADVSSGKVQSIFIDRYIPSKDSTIEQKLFWEIDKYFSIGSIIEKENQPDKTHFTKVAWQ